MRTKSQRHETPLVISNMDVGDMTFDSDVGAWNVTRALRDCASGQHKAYRFDVSEVMAATAAVEIDAAKVKAMANDPERLAGSPPPIFAGENGRIWLIDGHHRVRALERLGLTSFLAYVIEEADAAPYRITFNGKRVAPWFTDQ
jgi:hypothetical protein